MMNLADYRQKIDDIDQQLLQLLNERAQLAVKIGQQKFESRVSVKSPERENRVIEHLLEENSGPLQEQHIRLIFSAIMTASKNLQHLYQSFEDV